ncbi:uncharacterized protein LOC132557458 [Ylistrum balloti]|uniref:uncharacterized protein LOC132557458 n=1 Tax=Ylistrum balloti TaxID=509963 RepID=UPI002905D2F4|nr:uncharacterized protein LOC132557458 [Ylistrum balloti]XP_060077930.1 uncharacterized protein LOC132557458 [Ylistrum balloti]
MEMMPLALLVVVALAATSQGAQVTQVNLDEQGCGTSHTIEGAGKVNVSTQGSVPLGEGCVVTFKSSSTNNVCDMDLVTCVNVESLKSMCYVEAEFYSSHGNRSLKLDCTRLKKPMGHWCVNGSDPLTLRLSKNNQGKPYSNYELVASVTTDCISYKPDTTRPAFYGKGEEEITFIDVEEAVHNTRVIGIVVGVCLACMFLVALLITYFYYKNKAYTGVPQD